MPGLGELNLRWTRPINGVPKMATVQRDAAGRYFVSFMVETCVATLPPKTNAVGIDVGFKDIVVTSDGWKSGNPRHLRRKPRALKRAQRALSRKAKLGNG
jgi:putative transposase